ncbi:ABC transporter substrate-binding protein [Roseiarcaceae bacterium H3SJ34-1]|uniref:ABC transporter substrate-binding protein n=1 Tax=Terripilifer ovatus TaxID=3032367 RepID=UPI003AB997AF|nr:ABC transporter substrate-binding protein [Roseiarcaceae bacterium H3SJ34-1]
MSIDPLPMSIALSNNERTRPVIQGRYQPQGIRLLPTVVHPSEMFWRQLKFAEFDISEMSLSSFFIAISKGDKRFVGLPIYTARMFFHTRIMVRKDRGIKTPADLKGKKIGVPEYQQTSAIWSRGVLQHEFGVHPKDIEWFMERTPDMSHGGSTGFKAPPGVKINQIPLSTNIGDMLMKGELDGALLYLNQPNLVDRSTADISEICEPLFPDQVAESTRFYNKTGLYPINHAMVIKREVHEKFPWAAVNIYHAMMAAKADVEKSAQDTLKDYVACGLVEPAAQKMFRGDPKGYGLRNSRKVVETIAQYVHEQGLTDRQVSVEELFAPSLLDL